jgi:exopolysaccharide biosynthesis predicted pyruvyltransferase EpsI
MEVPDMAFMLGVQPEHTHGNASYDVVVMLRGDAESAIGIAPERLCNAITKTNLSCNVVDWLNPRFVSLRSDNGIHDYISSAHSQAFGVLSSGRVVVTDRLHGTLVSYFANRGVIVIDNLSKKTYGVLSTGFKSLEEICLRSDETFVYVTSNDINDIVNNTLNVYKAMYDIIPW